MFEGLIAKFVRQLLPEWTVLQEPVVSGRQPDLVAIDPDGRAYVGEVKVGEAGSPAHLGALIQAADYRKALETQYGDPVHAVLLTNLDLRGLVEEAAHDLGIDVVRVPGPDAEATAKRFASWANRFRPAEAAAGT